jgi:hypothetical protein
MKPVNFTFTMAILLMAMSILAGCQLMSTKEGSVPDTVILTRQDLQDLQDDANKAAEKVVMAKEWNNFKMDADITIRNNAICIAEIRVKLEKTGTTPDQVYVKKIDRLEQQNKDLKRRIKVFQEDQSDWESFKLEFNQDLDELGRSLKDLSVERSV